jgi:hypothetical protein
MAIQDVARNCSGALRVERPLGHILYRISTEQQAIDAARLISCALLP